MLHRGRILQGFIKMSFTGMEAQHTGQYCGPDGSMVDSVGQKGLISVVEPMFCMEKVPSSVPFTSSQRFSVEDGVADFNRRCWTAATR